MVCLDHFGIWYTRFTFGGVTIRFSYVPSPVRQRLGRTGNPAFFSMRTGKHFLYADIRRYRYVLKGQCHEILCHFFIS